MALVAVALAVGFLLLQAPIVRATAPTATPMALRTNTPVPDYPLPYVWPGHYCWLPMVAR